MMLSAVESLFKNVPWTRYVTIFGFISLPGFSNRSLKEYLRNIAANDANDVCVHSKAQKQNSGLVKHNRRCRASRTAQKYSK